MFGNWPLSHRHWNGFLISRIWLAGQIQWLELLLSGILFPGHTHSSGLLVSRTRSPGHKHSSGKTEIGIWISAAPPHLPTGLRAEASSSVVLLQEASSNSAADHSHNAERHMGDSGAHSLTLTANDSVPYESCKKSSDMKITMALNPKTARR